MNDFEKDAFFLLSGIYCLYIWTSILSLNGYIEYNIISSNISIEYSIIYLFFGLIALVIGKLLVKNKFNMDYPNFFLFQRTYIFIWFILFVSL